MNMQIRCLHIKNLENQEIPLFTWANSGLLDTLTTFLKTSTMFLKILMPPGWQQILFKWQRSQTVFEKSSMQPEDCSHTRRIYRALTKEKKRYINTLYHAIAIRATAIQSIQDRSHMTAM